MYLAAFRKGQNNEEKIQEITKKIICLTHYGINVFIVDKSYLCICAVDMVHNYAAGTFQNKTMFKPNVATNPAVSVTKT